MAFKDLTGEVFGRWTVLKQAPYDSTGTRWYCKCECGVEKSVMQRTLLNGRSTSCGCLSAEARLKANTKHGHSGHQNKKSSPTYKTWAAMKRRCSDKNHRSRANYYDKGIKVCKRWLCFKGFLKDMGERPEGHTLDRIDSDKDYKPSNCRWATPQEQARNMKTNHYLEHDGKRMIIVAWAKELGINEGTIRARLSRGWSTERALSK